MADPSTCPPLTPEAVRTAHSVIKPYVYQTPVFTSKTLNRIASTPNPDNVGAAKPVFRLYFKCENLQKIGAFKARGAFHALLRLCSEMGIEAVRTRGVTTHSSGNHAQALALAASTLDIPAHIVMPSISTPSKIDGTQAYGARVIFSGSTEPERVSVVQEVIAETGAILVPPYDHPDIILGQGTASLELEEQVVELLANQSRDHDTLKKEHPLDAVITPLGGGGLLAGSATYFSGTPSTRVFGAEPSFQGGDDGRRGLAAGSRISEVRTLTIADGLRTPMGEINWTVISDQNKVSGLFAVTEDQIKVAMKLVLERMKLVIEPSAAVPLAVILFDEEFRAIVEKEGGEKGWDVGVVFSGGNTTVEAIYKLYADS
ncbi:hypothetical protein ASPVEDRAFT_875964 [Aspergillus versicolor CBS 583.65]|uniref:Tryptophan synthase beta chain-like PALP domain-containing protein n=1 Tax=Aspergillus versicolor CBS 583.65 TaxID=1036611 RepID=A0A1L9PZ12_ASPVE|nr:uncharacterized protein ASPVEDRAFT_875964 [Aspergillus versicolor CBS 583.65]OJJ06754.1 hypothetical protein ASPVEDRAFT_875964 [Aspergillus versicolor CBS 583.65]